MFYSPLRYPGGKNNLAKFLAAICSENNIKGHYVEPYAGGAAIALYLIIKGYVSKITINDIDRSIYAFWHTILKHTGKFCYLIEKTEVNIKNWKKCREIQKNKEKANLFDLGFSTFFLNRTNVSGIINGGVIGGLEQKGKYKMNCRFNKKDLIVRIKTIARYKRSIKVTDLDALALVDKLKNELKRHNTILYFDPPYYSKGESLYFNHYKRDDHKLISDKIKRIENSPWIVSYDNVIPIRKLYKGYEKIEYSLFHTARDAKIGKEILFFSKNLKHQSIFNQI